MNIFKDYNESVLKPAIKFIGRHKVAMTVYVLASVLMAASPYVDWSNVKDKVKGVVGKD